MIGRVSGDSSLQQFGSRAIPRVYVSLVMHNVEMLL